MTAPLPSEIQVVESDAGVRWVLPRRRLGCMGAGVGVFFTVFGLAFASGPLAGMAGTLGGDTPKWIAIPFVLFLSLFVLVGLVPLGIGLLLLAGRSEVELRDGTLIAADGVGPLLYRRRRDAAKVRRLSIHTGTTTVNDKPVTEGPLAELGALKVESDGAADFAVALAYPKSLLEPLAADLSRRLGLDPAAVEVVVEDPAKKQEPTFVERPTQPTASRVTVEEHADGVTLVVPPAGLWKGSKGLFFFALLWNGFMTVFTTLALSSGGPDGMGVLMFVLVLLLFWSIGIGLLLGSVHMGRRRAVLAVAGGSLMVMQSGPLGTKRKEWPIADVADVRSGPSGIESNDVPVLELQILPVYGGKFGLLAGRDEEELAWLATVLRRAVGLPRDDDPSRARSAAE